MFKILASLLIATVLAVPMPSMSFEVKLLSSTAPDMVWDIHPYVITGSTIFFGYEGESRGVNGKGGGQIIQFGTENYCKQSKTTCDDGRWSAVDNSSTREHLNYDLEFLTKENCDIFVDTWNSFCDIL